MVTLVKAMETGVRTATGGSGRSGVDSTCNVDAARVVVDKSKVADVPQANDSGDLGVADRTKVDSDVLSWASGFLVALSKLPRFKMSAMCMQGKVRMEAKETVGKLQVGTGDAAVLEVLR